MPAGPAGEVEAATTAYSTTSRETDGSFSTEISTVPMNYVDSSGDWHEIDDRLVPDPGADYVAQNAAASYTVRIPEDPSATPLRFVTDQHWVSIRLHGADDETPDVAGNQATIDQNAAGQVAYEATPLGLKESITLTDAPKDGVSPKYFYTIDADPSLSPSIDDDGNVVFSTSDGEAVTTVPAAVMWDSSGTESGTSTDIGYDLQARDGHWELVMTPSSSWLTNPARQYPVVIDPSLTNQPPSTDCYIGTENPTVSHCGQSNLYLKAGKKSNGQRLRGLVAFDTSAIPGAAVVSSATANLYLDASQTPTTNQAQYALFNAGKKFDNTATWQSAGANGSWVGGNPDPNASSGVLTMNGQNAGYKAFDLTSVVQGWIGHTYANNGLVLQQVDEQTSNYVNFFTSSSSNAAAVRPYLTVNYDLVFDNVMVDADGVYHYIQSDQLPGSQVEYATGTVASDGGCDFEESSGDLPQNPTGGTITESREIAYDPTTCTTATEVASYPTATAPAFVKNNLNIPADDSDEALVATDAESQKTGTASDRQTTYNLWLNVRVQDPLFIKLTQTTSGVAYHSSSTCILDADHAASWNWFSQDGWARDSKSFSHGTTCAYTFTNVTAKYHNDPFCPGPTTYSHHNETRVDGYPQGHWSWHRKIHVGGGCASLLSYHHTAQTP